MADHSTNSAHGRASQAAEEALATSRQALFDRLNPRQRLAVESPAESCLVLAGAGSGKTSVLTARIARLVSSSGYRPSSVMAVTFTNKAAREMRERLFSLLPGRQVMMLAMGTFHSLCARMLRDHHQEAGLPKNFAILDTDGQATVVKDIMTDLVLTKKAAKAQIEGKTKQSQPQASLDLAGAATAPSTTETDEDEDDSDLEREVFVEAGDVVRHINKQKESREAPVKLVAPVTYKSATRAQMEAVYAEYEVRLARSGLLDFQDLLVKGVALLKNNEKVRTHYRNRIRVLLIDEFQDTNAIQYEWLQLLKGPEAHVMAVGDDSQAIYAFRGATPENMPRFVREMTTTPKTPQGKVIKLEENYRSLPYILDAANAIIDNNPDQLKKTLFTSQPDRGETIDWFQHSNGVAEARHIAEDIHEKIRSGVPASEIAVIYRTNLQSRLIEHELNKKGVPLSVYGGFRFFDRAEIKNVVAYLDLVSDVTRDISFLRVANFPKRDLGERTIEDLRQEAQIERISMMEMVGKREQMIADGSLLLTNATSKKKHAALSGFCDLILKLAEFSESHSLAELIEEVIEATGIRKHYEDEADSPKGSAEESAERLANILELLSAAKQFETDNPHLPFAAQQLPEYLTQVALMSSTSEADMATKNTVSLMTGHSSKGLEFDHVYLVGVEEGTLPHARSIAQDEEALTLGLRPDQGIQEERRLMYVMVTRARKGLTIHTAKTRLVGGMKAECIPSRFISEIPEHRVSEISDEDLDLESGKAYRTAQRNHRSSNYEYGGDAFDSTRDASNDRVAAPAPIQAAQPPAAPAPQPAPAAPPSAVSPTDHPDESAKPWLQRGRTQHAVSTASSLDAPATRRIAIVGTAGTENPQALSRALWAITLADAAQRVRRTDHLVAGGAAWMEHLAVQLFLEGRVTGLTLHLPAPFVQGQFLGPDRSAGAAANAVHQRFSDLVGINSRADLSRAIARGAEVTTQPVAAGYSALVARSRRVASDADAVLAYTFAGGAEPSGAGARETWDLVLGPKVHIPIDRLLQAPMAIGAQQASRQSMQSDQTALQTARSVARP